MRDCRQRAAQQHAVGRAESRHIVVALPRRVAEIGRGDGGAVDDPLPGRQVDVIGRVVAADGDVVERSRRDHRGDVEQVVHEAEIVQALVVEDVVELGDQRRPQRRCGAGSAVALGALHVGFRHQVREVARGIGRDVGHAAAALVGAVAGQRDEAVVRLVPGRHDLCDVDTPRGRVVAGVPLDARAIHRVLVPHGLDEFRDVAGRGRHGDEAAHDQLPQHALVALDCLAQVAGRHQRGIARRGGLARQRRAADQQVVGLRDIVVDVGEAVGDALGRAAVAQCDDGRLVLEGGIDEQLPVGPVVGRIGRHALRIVERVRRHRRQVARRIPDRALDGAEDRGVGVAVGIAGPVVELDVGIGIDGRDDTDVE